MLAPSVPARARKSSATFGAGKMILLGLAAILLFGSLGAGTVVVMKRLRGDAGLATLREGTAEPQPGQQDTGLADQDREGSGTVAQSPAASDPGQNGDLTPTAVQPAAAAVQPAETAVQPAETAVQPAETAVQPAETAVQPAEADPDQAATADPIPNDPPSADIAAPAAAGGGRDREASDVLVARASPLIRTNPADAQRLLEEAVLRDERNPHAAAGLAETHLASGNLREALHWAEQAISLRRRRAEYRLLLGDVLRADGKIDEARRAYRQALRYDPDDRDARARLAEL